MIPTQTAGIHYVTVIGSTELAEVLFQGLQYRCRNKFGVTIHSTTQTSGYETL